MYDLRNVGGHIEVYNGGEFVLSADTYTEAISEINTLIDNARHRRFSSVTKGEIQCD